MKTQTKKQFHVLFAIIFISIIVAVLFPWGNSLLMSIRGKSIVVSGILPYEPSAGLQDLNFASSEAAIAVPILMYHGVIVDGGTLGANVTRDNFILQMEMLKRNGYQTITVKDYDNFRSGTFNLPPKPIIITFDDGRKDSYYTVDKILEKLDFKATMFVATVKANKNDPFYLSWDELKKVKATGRWEIEAHGQRSHDKVLIDAQKTEGRYLTSRIFDELSGLESVENFEKRVREDYINGISDLKHNLGIEPLYYAIPLNNYGGDDSNYEGASSFNQQLTKQYFRLAFVQALNKNNKVGDTFYNYIDSNPQTLKRLEVKNMSSEQLESALLEYAPSAPTSIFPSVKNVNGDISPVIFRPVYGIFLTAESEILMVTNATSTVGRVLVGDKGWQDYSFDLQFERGTARSGLALLYYSDESNLINLFWNPSTIGLIERVDGVDKYISEIDVNFSADSQLKIRLLIKNQLLTASLNDFALATDYPVTLTRGAPGFGIWNPEGDSTIKVTNFLVKSAE